MVTLGTFLHIDSLNFPQASLMPSNPLDIPLASCSLCNSPIYLLTNSKIILVKQIIVTLGRLHSMGVPVSSVSSVLSLGL